MYTERVKRLEERLTTKQCELAFITSPIHIFYYTNFLSEPHERFFAYVYDQTKEKSYLFLPTLDYDKAKSLAKVDELIPVSDVENGYEKMKATLGRNFSSIAVEKETMTLAELDRLQAVFSNLNLLQIDNFIIEERMNKQATEIEQVKKAIDITEQGLEHIVQFVKPGMTEMEIKQELEFKLFSLGAEQMAFDTLVLSGKNSSLPHGTSGNNEVKEGDFLLFDFGVTVNGYNSDITRTFIVGEASEEQKVIYDTVKRANEDAILKVKVDVPLKEVDLAARNVIEKANYGKYFTHRVGHGLGLEVHELPSIHSENNELMRKGMLFTIEPGIYVPDLGGVRIEDNIFINESGKAEVLTTYPKQLITIEP